MPSARVDAFLTRWAASDRTSLNLRGNLLNAADWSELIALVDSLQSVVFLHLGVLTNAGITAAVTFARRLPGLRQLGLVGVDDQELCQLTGHLPSLTHLGLSWCGGVTDAGVVAVAEHLTALTHLDLPWCGRVTDAGVAAVAERLTALTHLNLSECGMVTDAGVAAVAEHLTALTHLDLSGCDRVTDAGVAAVAEYLTALTHLDLSGCIQVMNAGIRAVAKRHRDGHLPHLRALLLSGTRVGLPNEVIQSRDAGTILRAALVLGAKPLREAKLLLVGNGEVGKSHLKDRLCGNPRAFDALKDRTHDIDFALWPETPARPRTRLWDFGGQPYLHGSHRFFLGADHAAYVLVLDATRTAASNHLHYWLRFIAHHAESTRAGEYAPVVIVVNKCDVGALAESRVFRDQWKEAAAIRERHADLLAGLTTAAAKGWHRAKVVGEPILGLGYFPRDRSRYEADEVLSTLPGLVPDDLHDAILAQHTQALDQIDTAVTAALAAVPSPSLGYAPEFHQLKAYLEDELTPSPLPLTTPWIDAGTEAWRKKVFGELGVREDEIEVWLRTLRSLGVLHWVGDFDAADREEYRTIRDRVFNPHWVKRPVYQLVRLSQGEHDRGRVKRRTIDARLSDYSADQRDAALELMLACKVAFKVRDQKKLGYSTDRLIPDLLEPRKRRPDPPPGERVVRRLAVPFLSDRVLLRFIGERYECVADPQDHCWRNQVEFPWPPGKGCVVRVASEIEGRAGERPNLRVEVGGGKDGEREYVAGQVCLELTQILRSEGLLKNDEEPETIDENQILRPLTREEWLERLIRARAGAHSWASEADAIEEHALRTGRTCSPGSFKDYRRSKRNGAFRIDDPPAGIDPNGYVWREVGGNVQYLREDLQRPRSGPYPPES